MWWCADMVGREELGSGRDRRFALLESELRGLEIEQRACSRPNLFARLWERCHCRVAVIRACADCQLLEEW